MEWMNNGPCQSCGHEESSHRNILDNCEPGCGCRKFMCQWCNVPAEKLRPMLLELLEAHCKANCMKVNGKKVHDEVCIRIATESGLGHGHYT